MLRLLLGRAKSGKTALVMEEIAARAKRKEPGNLLLVPEQYSHEAETELLRVCGDSLSLYGEVLSFTRLYQRVAAELGFWNRTALDAGGRRLCLARALDAVGGRLQVFGAARRQTSLHFSLLSAIDECKTGLVGADALRAFAAGAPAGDGLGAKLADLALLLEAYDAVAAQSGLDPLDRLNLLAERIGESGTARCHFWIDGFTDFTAQQNAVLAALLRAGAEVTVCLTAAGLDEDHEIFEPSRRAALRLQRLAKEAGVPWEILLRREEEAPGTAMQFLERELFAFDEARWEGDTEAVALLRCGGVDEECEAAAARCLELVRHTGCRWRDIAVAARDFERYRPALESAFRRYGVPLYTARRSDILSKPLPTLISAAYAAVCRGWEYADVMGYFKTGLAGLDPGETDTLENYAFLWTLHGGAWSEDEDWTQHPRGFGLEFDPESEALLAELNALRRRCMQPLWVLAERAGAAATAAEQARAMADFFDALRLPEQLSRRAEQLRALGMVQEAAEYVQLWEIAAGALEQCFHILGDAEMDAETFGQLYLLTLSAYDVGSIPLSLDKVSAGDMSRMRRRHLRHLIVLGCDSETLPSVAPVEGIFTDEDREALSGAGISLGESADRRLEREFALLYNCLTLPSETVCMSWTSAGAVQPAFVVRRSAQLFGSAPERADLASCRMEAPGPALELAAGALRRGHGPESDAAWQCFSRRGESGTLERLRSAAALTRGRLSPGAVRALYGDRLRLSATRADKLAGCGFGYFMEFGLRAKPRKSAAFTPPELGSFMHDVLEGVAREIQERGGFARAEQAAVEALCDKYVERYVHERLLDFRQKSPRFVYLFRRLTGDVKAVVLDMTEELKQGDFVPLDFELDFGDRAAFPPIELGSGEGSLALVGKADRVDGWLHEDKLYLRIMDYKTGRKAFSLSDVWYGMGLQMLLYLFALERVGRERYGREIVPAGVLYVPARDVLISARAGLSPEEIMREKAKQLRRSGVLLDDSAVLDAMERGESPRYLPIRYNKDGRAAGDALASAERLGLLSRHVDKTLQALARELREGSIAADPWYRSQTENACRFCDYVEACQFRTGEDHPRYLASLKSGEVWEKLEQEETEQAADCRIQTAGEKERSHGL